MKKIVVSFFVLTLLLTLTTLAQETITLSTYYPSPFGIYNRLATNSFGVGDNNSSGGIEAGDSPDPAVAGQEGDVWIAGDIGIGTTNPEARVHLRGDSPISMIEATQANQAAHLYLRTPTAIWQLEADSGGIDEGFRIDESTTSMGDSGTTRFVIRNGGRVGIGTRNPRARLDVGGGVRLGNDSNACDSTKEGTQRYSTARKNVEFCDGSTWKTLGTAPSTYYCFKDAGYGTPVCVDAGGSQGFCPAGQTQQAALGEFGECFYCGRGCDNSYPFMPGTTCGSRLRFRHVAGDAYLCL
jgi:hypothetical protein